MARSDTDIAKTPKRRRMAPEQRRLHILDAAQKLFFMRGWDEVTIADVLTEAGISKGGFYHHFTAKEDLLDGVVGRFTADALASAQSARAATSGDALTRFNAFLAETNRWKSQQAPGMKFLIDVMIRPGNDGMCARITAAAHAAATPVLLDMIAQGVDEGAFDVPDIDLVAEMIVAMSQGRHAVLVRAVEAADTGDLDHATDIMNTRMMAEAALIDRLLGLPRGSVRLSNPTEFRHMLRAFAKTTEAARPAATPKEIRQ